MEKSVKMEERKESKEEERKIEAGTLPRRKATLRTPFGIDYKLLGHFLIEMVSYSPSALALKLLHHIRSSSR